MHTEIQGFEMFDILQFLGSRNLMGKSLFQVSSVFHILKCT